MIHSVAMSSEREADLSRAESCERRDERLTSVVLEQGAGASTAAMRLLECCDPPTLAAAIALVADEGAPTVVAFDRLADAWEIYRHVRHHAWD